MLIFSQCDHIIKSLLIVLVLPAEADNVVGLCSHLLQRHNTEGYTHGGFPFNKAFPRDQKIRHVSQLWLSN